MTLSATITVENGQALPPTETALAVYDRRDVALRAAIDLWASATTGANTRRRDELVAKKRNAVENFFKELGKEPGEVTPQDVQAWCERMRRENGRSLASATVYTRVSFLSSFYVWAQRIPSVTRRDIGGEVWKCFTDSSSAHRMPLP